MTKRADKDERKSEKEKSSTDAGYDEAARSGPGTYGKATGDGGVFGTSGGGSFEGGMHIEERPMPYVYPDDEDRETKK